MISVDNIPSTSETFDQDFTEAHYRELLCAAKATYCFSTYDAIPWGARFILWRHDLDYSINRAAALAQIEANEGVVATYFVNPRSEFYNPFESSQSRLIKRILSLGHRLGLHFDAAFYDIRNEDQLSHRVAQEARWLEVALDTRPAAFSFHNPSSAHLQLDADSYGGLVNCYSHRLKAEISYCSDSNGYWRFSRLREVLAEAKDPCLHVLTHPGWWQEVAMPPRQRVFRCVFGRAKATMRGYDDGLRVYGRVNQFGPSISLNFLDSLNRELFELCDYLWNTGQIRTLLIELWRLHERQIYKLCKAQLRKQWKVPACQLNAFFDAPTLLIDGGALFKAVFSTNLCKAARLKEVNYRECSVLCNALIHGRSSERRQQVEDSCLFLCAAIESLVAWGQQRSIKYDGISQLDVIGIPTFKTVDGSLTDRLEEGADDIKNFPLKKWEQFKADILKVGAAGMAQVSLL